ncbi:DUF4303 domain-containing protein [Sphingomonas sp.]|uniref:DUF4303 domain-containing protein n=1 Tax=Sphingomonas sp. TaxID=28214 RepID=UPI003B3A17DB
MNWDDITRQLTQATIAAVDDLLRELDGERLYALALVTDDDWNGASLAANTEEWFAARLAAETEPDEDMHPNMTGWYRWGVGEWRNENYSWDLFKPVCDLLWDYEGPTRVELGEAMTVALEHLRRERAEALAGITLFITLTDSDDAEAVENASAMRLNPPPLLDAFLARYASALNDAQSMPEGD